MRAVSKWYMREMVRKAVRVFMRKK